MERKLAQLRVSCVMGCTVLLFLSATAFTGCAHEPEVLKDSADRNDREIYENVLQGELAVEHNGQRVSIGELFWDNDIEYCFFDIDGDGRDELHIRDGAVYYAVKVLDEAPQIILEIWWYLDPDREELVANLQENELEWTGRRLKNFTTWQEAYLDFIDKIHVTVPSLNGFSYSLIFVDADDIPELYIFTGGMATGEIIVSFYEGKIGTINRDRIGMAYMEHGGLLYSESGAMGYYPCNIYKLERGEFSEIGTGWYLERDDGQGNLCDDYYWEGIAVTEAEYEAHIEELIDTSICMEPSLLYSEDEILEILGNRGNAD